MTQAEPVPLRVADLLCGVGAYRIAAEDLDMRCVYCCDSSLAAQSAHAAHFGTAPDGDLLAIDPVRVPEHDILTAGLPFGLGFTSAEDGNAILSKILHIIRAKRPKALVLENVGGLLNSPKAMPAFERALTTLGYTYKTRVLKCEELGIPQSRQRAHLVALRSPVAPHTGPDPASCFVWPRHTASPCLRLSEFLGDPRIQTPLAPTMRGLPPGSTGPSGSQGPEAWAHVRLKTGDKLDLTIEQAQKLQGLPASYDWGPTVDADPILRWALVGNASPVNVCKAVLACVRDALELKAPPPVTVQPAQAPQAQTHTKPAAPQAQTVNYIQVKSGTGIAITLPKGVKEADYKIRVFI